MAEGTIGGVGVSVVPDATDFWRRFVEQTRPGAVRAGADLGTDVRRGMQGELDRGVDVRVNANTAGARANIESLDKTASSASSGGMSKLIIAAAAIAPALIPIGAVAIPAIATLALGAKRAGQEIKHGLTDEFHDLQHAAGRSLTPGVEDLVHSLQKAQPQLKQLIGVFGGAISDELSKLSDALDNGELQSFINYAEQELPVVEHAFNSILGAVVDIGKALAPVGDTLVKDADQVAQLVSGVVHLLEQLNKARNEINDLPVPGGSSGTLQEIAKGNLPFALEGINKGLSIASQELDHFLGGGATGKLVGDAHAVADAMNKEAQAFANTAKGLANYDSKIAAHISNRIAAVQAENSFIVAARGVADAVKANGHTLDAATAAGQQNRDALIGAASAAVAFYNAQIQAGVASATAAQDAGRQREATRTDRHRTRGWRRGRLTAC
jgi:hypothetical protein